MIIFKRSNGQLVSRVNKINCQESKVFRTLAEPEMSGFFQHEKAALSLCEPRENTY